MNKNKLKIIVAGIYNSGKSSLLNALTKGNNFKVGDVPTTATIDTFETDDYVYVDTPGLNANNYDNNTAEQAFKNADMIIFVSNMQNGGLNSAEAEYLKKLAQTLGGMDLLQQQVMFAMSNLHQIEDDAVDKIITEHKNMIKLALGFAPENVYIFDSVTYQEGVSQNEEALIEASGIPALLKHIEKFVADISENIEKIRYKKIISKSRALRDKLEEIIAPLEAEYKKVKQIVDTECIDEEKVNAILKEYSQESFSIYLSSYEMSKYDFERYFHSKISYSYDSKSYGDRPSGKRYFSESSLLSDVKADLSKVYNRRGDAVKEKTTSSFDGGHYSEYLCYEQSSNNGYYREICSLNKIILELNDKLLACNVSLPQALLHEVNINFNNYPNYTYSSAFSEIINRFMEVTSYTTLDEYIDDYADIRSEETGILWSKIYSLSSVSDIIYAMNRNWAKEYNEIIKEFENKIKRIGNEFSGVLNSAYQNRMKEIKTEVESVIKIKNNNDAKKQADELKAKITPLRQQINALNKILNEVENEH